MSVPPAVLDLAAARYRTALERYAEPLLRQVVAKLVQPRTLIPADELAERCGQTVANPPVIDRRLRDLTPAARAILTWCGLSRVPEWKVGHLVLALASLGHHEGMAPILELLNQGLLVPAAPDAAPIEHFEAWLGTPPGTLSASVWVHPSVALRARGEGFTFPELATVPAGGATLRQSDGLDWPLRLALVWQQVALAPIRRTASRTLFKRDLEKYKTDPLLSAPTPDQPSPAPEPGVLALVWAEAAGVVGERDGFLVSLPFPPEWGAGLWPCLTQLASALARIETWDAGAGYAPPEEELSAAPTAMLLTLFLLSSIPADRLVPLQPLADWLWDKHPSWQGRVSKLAPTLVRQRGLGWVESFLLGVAYPLKLVECGKVEGDWCVRLTDFGRHTFAQGAEPPAPLTTPQALLVQPNAEILAYRQGLTPALISRLTRIAKWKALGPACTLELTAETTYHGLESGLTMAGMLQTLNQHGMKTVPATVVDLLRRWSDKRDRISVFPSATLVEFQSAADLDTAIARGVVSIRVTDRIGLTDEGREPDFKQLRLVGNRDYETKPQQCVKVGPDGVTLTIDTAVADLLVEAELPRFADLIPRDPPGVRRYAVTPATLKRGMGLGLTVVELDAWFHARSGAALPPAIRLLAPPAATSPAWEVERLLVVRLPTESLADGVAQYPATAEFIAERLGPKALAVEPSDFAELKEVLASLGIALGDDPG